MSKKNKTILGIFTESVGLYFSNFDKFVKYMSFPVLGQALGLLWICFCMNFYINFMPKIIDKYAPFDNANVLAAILLIIISPGMLLFIKSFWEYLVAYGALNSMFENMLHSGKVYDFDAHTELVKRKRFNFIGIWCVISVFSFLALNPLLWVPACILGVFIILVFQVFTFEAEQNVFGCFKKSIELVKGHFVPTFWLASLSFALTYIFIPEIAKMGFKSVHITDNMTKSMIPIISQLPIQNVETFFANYNLSLNITEFLAVSVVTGFIAQIFIQYTLPLRSILWSMWYKELNGGLTKIELKTKNKSANSKSKTRRPSEKLMEESHKKFTTKKIDKNILKRAMERDDEE